MFAERGLPAPAPRPATQPTDWAKVLAPLNGGVSAPRRRRSFGAKALVSWFVVLGFYGLAARMFPQG
jgi:hypothetical protein